MVPVFQVYRAWFGDAQGMAELEGLGLRVRLFDFLYSKPWTGCRDRGIVFKTLVARNDNQVVRWLWPGKFHKNGSSRPARNC